MSNAATNMATNNNVQYDDNLRGVLYKNEKKTSEKHPNARGRAMIEGVWFWVSAWTQFSRRNGQPYQSLAFTKMTDDEVNSYINNRGQHNEAQEQSQHPVNQPPANDVPPVDAYDDEIPF